MARGVGDGLRGEVASGVGGDAERPGRAGGGGRGEMMRVGEQRAADAMRRVARNVRRLASAQRITVAELAGRSGIGLGVMSRLLEGEGVGVGDPRLSMITALAEALGVDVFELLVEGGEGG